MHKRLCNFSANKFPGEIKAPTKKQMPRYRHSCRMVGSAKRSPREETRQKLLTLAEGLRGFSYSSCQPKTYSAFFWSYAIYFFPPRLVLFVILQQFCKQIRQVLRAHRLPFYDLKFGHARSKTIPPTLNSSEVYVLLSREIVGKTTGLRQFCEYYERQRGSISKH